MREPSYYYKDTDAIRRQLAGEDGGVGERAVSRFSRTATSVRKVKEYSLRDNPRNKPPLQRGLTTPIWLIRVGKDISQRELAMLMDCPRSYISKVELGQATPTLFSIQSAALGVDLCALIALAEVIARGAR